MCRGRLDGGGCMEDERVRRPDWLKKVIAAGGELHYKKQPRLRHNLVNLGSLAGVALALGGLIDG